MINDSVSKLADISSEFFRGIKKLYPEISMNSTGSEVEITLKVKRLECDALKFENVKVINNGVDITKKFIREAL